MKHLVLVVALAAFSTSAFAGGGAYQNEAELRLVQNVSVEISDDVTDGCLSNPNALKVEAELILRRSGISVDVRDLLGPQYVLQIGPLGFETGSRGSCAVTLTVELWRIAQVPEGHSALITAYEAISLLTGHTEVSMQEALRTRVSEWVSDLANEILKARGN